MCQCIDGSSEFLCAVMDACNPRKVHDAARGVQLNLLGKAVLVHAAPLTSLCLPLHALCRQIGCDNQWRRLHSA